MICLSAKERRKTRAALRRRTHVVVYLAKPNVLDPLREAAKMDEVGDEYVLLS